MRLISHFLVNGLLWHSGGSPILPIFHLPEAIYQLAVLRGLGDILRILGGNGKDGALDSRLRGNDLVRYRVSL